MGIPLFFICLSLCAALCAGQSKSLRRRISFSANVIRPASFLFPHHTKPSFESPPHTPDIRATKRNIYAHRRDFPDRGAVFCPAGLSPTFFLTSANDAPFSAKKNMEFILDGLPFLGNVVRLAWHISQCLAHTITGQIWEEPYG